MTVGETIDVTVVSGDELTRSAIERCLHVAPGVAAGAGSPPASPSVYGGRPRRRVAVLDVDDHPGDIVLAAGRLHDAHDAVVMIGRRLPPALVRRSVQAGIDAVVSKSCGVDELLVVIRRVARGQSHVAPRVAADVLLAEVCPLTSREVDVLRLLDRALSTRQCAAELNLAEGTVRNLASSAVRKTGAAERSAAASRARDLGWI